MFPSWFRPRRGQHVRPDLPTPARGCPRLEALEDRCLLNGNLSGTVFIDYHGNGIAQSGDPPLPAVQVFIDRNNNGQLDTTELSTTADAAGHYTFTNLPDGTYTVREVVPPGFALTQPADDVRIGVVGLDIASGPLDFGNRPASPLLPVDGAADLYGPRPSADQASAFVKGLYHAVLGRDADSLGLRATGQNRGP